MSYITERYFLGNAAIAKTLMTQWEATQIKAQQLIKALIEEFAADGLYREGAKIVGLSYNSAPNELKVAPEGLAASSFFDDERHVTVHKPKRQFKTGKALQVKLDAINDEMQQNPSFSKFVIKALALNHEVMGASKAHPGRTMITRSSAGVAKEQLVVLVPDGGESETTFPTIPSTLKEIKRSEFIALTEED